MKDVNESFWEVKDLHLKDHDKQFIIKHYNIVKLVFSVLATLLLTNFCLFFIPKFILDDQTLPFLIYRPKWTNFYGLLLLEMFVSLFAQILPMLTVTTTFMTVTNLTLMQFRMVNTEIEYHFGNMSNDSPYTIIKKIVDHHNFLLR